MPVSGADEATHRYAANSPGDLDRLGQRWGWEDAHVIAVGERCAPNTVAVRGVGGALVLRADGEQVRTAGLLEVRRADDGARRCGVVVVGGRAAVVPGRVQSE